MWSFCWEEVGRKVRRGKRVKRVDGARLQAQRRDHS